ncbi:MAG: hypothetical protein HeimC3_32710 [Candidatus Heimdallarchaeota archaeon LC_3]|nr:MAG: hypothetical protein HeimC3_32710 [Candidatus Heimdallarchaeota archaeon LC_3]
MFVRIITYQMTDEAINEIETIGKEILAKTGPILRDMKGWIKTELIIDKKNKVFKTIAYWNSRDDAKANKEYDPKLPGFLYMQIGRYAQHLDDSNLIIEHYDLLETIE